MRSSMSLFKIINAVLPDSKNLFRIVAFVPDVAIVNPNGTRKLFANDVRIFFINGKPTDINGLRKLRNPASWIVTFVVVSYNKTHLVSKDPITFITALISLFASVILEPVRLFLIFWPITKVLHLQKSFSPLLCL